jgi:hypothetical protein
MLSQKNASGYGRNNDWNEFWNLLDYGIKGTVPDWKG